MRFDDKVVLITGAASGIGLATAELLAERGAILALNDINIEGVEEVVAQISSRGGSAMSIAGDIAARNFASDSVSSVIRRHGRVDVLLNVAGVASYGPAESYDQWDHMIEVNLNAGFLLCSAVAKQSMIPRRSGSIVNVASLSGLVAHPFDVGYIVSKHGIVGLTKALAIEWAPHNIRVNCLCPGYTQTGVFAAVEKSDPDRFRTRAARVPMGRSAAPREQATALAFLASDDASFVTGLVMPVDGGQMALSSGWQPLPVPDASPI